MYDILNTLLTAIPLDQSILSGPAGGVVGFALTSWEEGSRPVIGLDMGKFIQAFEQITTENWLVSTGGTSTDVSRFDGDYETVFETTTAGVTIQSPQLNINTVSREIRDFVKRV